MRRSKKQQETEIVNYIHNTPDLHSLLCDIDLMPEQLKRDSHDWRRMLIISERWKSMKNDMRMIHSLPECLGGFHED